MTQNLIPCHVINNFFFFFFFCLEGKKKKTSKSYVLCSQEKKKKMKSVLRRTTVLRAAVEADTTSQWPFGRPEARGTQRKYIPYAKTILEGVAAKMAEKKQDPPTLISVCNHLHNFGKGSMIARNHWNQSGEIDTFVTITEILNHKPPYELSQCVGYVTINGETSNSPVYIPQQSYAGWTVVGSPPHEPVIEVSSREGTTIEFSTKIIISGIDYATPIQEIKTTIRNVVDSNPVYCEYIEEGYQKATQKALLIFDKPETAYEAYKQLHHQPVDGAVISVNPAIGAVPRPPSIGVEVPVDYSFGKMPAEPSMNW